MNRNTFFFHRLALIPAKAHSCRCPGKNLRPLGGLPLFLHSVHYALHEGFTPVVSTDSDEVAAICRLRQIRCIRERVDDRRMENCAVQLLGVFSCDWLAILQPTSPFRETGLLGRMVQGLAGNDAPSAYTAEKIKLIGHLDGSFQHAYREQDARRFFYFFDGNILLVRNKSFLSSGQFFNDRSIPFPNSFPCSLQIDSEAEFELLSRLSDDAAYASLLPPTPGKMKVCLISNKNNLKRSYSTFVDSCDRVMRVSKMENLDSGLTGRKTDVVLVSCFPGYLAFDRRTRHVDELKKVPEIYFNNEAPGWASEFAGKEGISRWKFMPSAVHHSTTNFTTLSKALCLADYLFPKAQLYYLGDTDAALRAPGSPKHPHGKENAYMQSLIESGRVIPILEEEEAIFRFSTPLVPLLPEAAPEKTKEPARPVAAEEEIEICHPLWNDTVRITGERAVRVRRPDRAKVRRRNAHVISLQWDRWGKEEFAKTEESLYRRLDYRLVHTVNEVNKYRKELLINPCDEGHGLFRHTDYYPFATLGSTQWDYLLLLDRMNEDVETLVNSMPRLQTVLFTGIGKDSLCSLNLALALKEKRPDLHIGALGCSWACDFSGRSPHIKLSPSHERVAAGEPYKSLLAQHGDAVTTLRNAAKKGRRIHVFGFYAWHSGCTSEQEATRRLIRYAARNYTWRAEEDEIFDSIHGKALQLARQNPALIQGMLEDAIQLTRTMPPERQHPEIDLRHPHFISAGMATAHRGESLNS